MSVIFSNKNLSNFITVFRVLALEIIVCYSFIIFIHDKTNIVIFGYGIFWFILLLTITIILTTSFILFRKFYFYSSFLNISNQTIILQKLDFWGRKEFFSVNFSEIVSIKANFKKSHRGRLFYFEPFYFSIFSKKTYFNIPEEIWQNPVRLTKILKILEKLKTEQDSPFEINYSKFDLFLLKVKYLVDIFLTIILISVFLALLLYIF